MFLQLRDGVFCVQAERASVSVPVGGFTKQAEDVSFQWARSSTSANSLISSKLLQNNVLSWLEGQSHIYLGSLLHVLLIHSFSFWYPSTDIFPRLCWNTITPTTENSVLKQHLVLFMEQGGLSGAVFLKIHNLKDYSFRTSAKKISLNWTSGFTKQSSELRPLTFWSCTDPHCMCTANI